MICEFYQFNEISHLRWVVIKDVINTFSGYSISSDLVTTVQIKNGNHENLSLN